MRTRSVSPVQVKQNLEMRDQGGKSVAVQNILHVLKMDRNAINVDHIEEILLEKLAYQNKFCQKVIKMVRDVECSNGGED